MLIFSEFQFCFHKYLKMKTMKFKNSNGSKPVSCGCPSALEHWERNVNRKAINCSVKGCTNSAKVGGHVINAHGNALNEQYIIPLCSAHNHSSFQEIFEINVHVKPVRIGRQLSCK